MLFSISNCIDQEDYYWLAKTQSKSKQSPSKTPSKSLLSRESIFCKAVSYKSCINSRIHIYGYSPMEFFPCLKWMMFLICIAIAIWLYDKSQATPSYRSLLTLHNEALSIIFIVFPPQLLFLVLIPPCHSKIKAPEHPFSKQLWYLDNPMHQCVSRTLIFHC